MVFALTQQIETSAGYVAAGHTGNGPPLVLVHGWPWSSYTWHQIIPALAQQYHVHWYDLPGYGASDKSAAQRTDLGVQGGVLTEVLDHWQLVRPTVMAHDFGGAITLRAHLLHGRDFERFILMNIVAMRPWGSAFFDHVGRHITAFQGLPPHIQRAIVEAYIKGALMSEITQNDLQALVAPWITPAGADSFYRQFEQADECYTAEVEPLFSKVRCPTDIIWGADDPWIPLARGQALQRAIGHASFHTLPGVGHLPQLEASEVLMKTLEQLFTAS